MRFPGHRRLGCTAGLSGLGVRRAEYVDDSTGGHGRARRGLHPGLDRGHRDVHRQVPFAGVLAMSVHRAGQPRRCAGTRHGDRGKGRTVEGAAKAVSARERPRDARDGGTAKLRGRVFGINDCRDDSAYLARCTDVAARTPLMECCSSDWMLDSNYSTNSIRQGLRTNLPARLRWQLAELRRAVELGSGGFTRSRACLTSAIDQMRSRRALP